MALGQRCQTSRLTPCRTNRQRLPSRLQCHMGHLFIRSLGMCPPIPPVLPVGRRIRESSPSPLLPWGLGPWVTPPPASRHRGVALQLYHCQGALLSGRLADFVQGGRKPFTFRGTRRRLTTPFLGTSESSRMGWKICPFLPAPPSSLLTCAPNKKLCLLDPLLKDSLLLTLRNHSWWAWGTT